MHSLSIFSCIMRMISIFILHIFIFNFSLYILQIFAFSSDVSRVFLGRPVHITNPQRNQHGWRQAEKFAIVVLPNTLKMHSLAPYVLIFFVKHFQNCLNFPYEKLFSAHDFLKIYIFKQNICMAIRL